MAAPPHSSQEFLRDEVAKYAAAQLPPPVLPDGWEASLLFTLRLPQVKVVEKRMTKTTIECSYPNFRDPQR
jgi:hypothetical protein